MFTEDTKANKWALRILWSYLDDFTGAAKDFDKTARQYAVFKVITEKLGLVALPSKFEPPSESQPILGVLYNSLSKTVALKSAKSVTKVVTVLDSIIEKDTWSVDSIQEVLSNLT